MGLEKIADNKEEFFIYQPKYIKNKQRKIIAHNLGVLYATINSKEFISKAIKYLMQD